MTIKRSQLKDANFCRGRADEARIMADMHSDSNAIGTVLDIADGYDVRVRGAPRARESGKSKSKKGDHA